MPSASVLASWAWDDAVERDRTPLAAFQRSLMADERRATSTREQPTRENTSQAHDAGGLFAGLVGTAVCR
jgi:hypothetical protein